MRDPCTCRCSLQLLLALLLAIYYCDGKRELCIVYEENQQINKRATMLETGPSVEPTPSAQVAIVHALASCRPTVQPELWVSCCGCPLVFLVRLRPDGADLTGTDPMSRRLDPLQRRLCLSLGSRLPLLRAERTKGRNLGVAHLLLLGLDARDERRVLFVEPIHIRMQRADLSGAGLLILVMVRQLRLQLFHLDLELSDSSLRLSELDCLCFKLGESSRIGDSARLQLGQSRLKIGQMRLVMLHLCSQLLLALSGVACLPLGCIALLGRGLSILVGEDQLGFAIPQRLSQIVVSGLCRGQLLLAARCAALALSQLGTASAQLLSKLGRIASRLSGALLGLCPLPMFRILLVVELLLGFAPFSVLVGSQSHQSIRLVELLPQSVCIFLSCVGPLFLRRLRLAEGSVLRDERFQFVAVVGGRLLEDAVL